MRRLVLAALIAIPVALAPSSAKAFVSPGFLVGEPGAAQVLAGRWRIVSWTYNDDEQKFPAGSDVVIGESMLQIAGVGWRFGDSPLFYKLDDPDATIVITMEVASKSFTAEAVIEVDGRLTLSIYGMHDDDEEIFVLERAD